MDDLQKVFDKIKYALMSDEQKKNKKKKEEIFKEREKELNSTLAKMEEKWKEENKKVRNYEELYKPDIGLKKKKLLELNKQDMADRAEAMFENKYRKNKQDIITKSARDYANAKKYIDDVYAKEQRDLLELRNRLDKARRSAKNKYIKNGMHSSSISDLVDDELDDIESQGKDIIIGESKRKASSKKAELDRLNTERDIALKNLELSKASSIKDELKRLEKEYTKLNNSITNYNNDIDEREAKYDVLRTNTIEDQRRQDRVEDRFQNDYEEYHGYVGKKGENYRSRLQLAYALYSQLPREEALEAVKKNGTLRMYLGGNYGVLLHMLGISAD